MLRRIPNVWSALPFQPAGFLTNRAAQKVCLFLPAPMSYRARVDRLGKLPARPHHWLLG